MTRSVYNVPVWQVRGAKWSYSQDSSHTIHKPWKRYHGDVTLEMAGYYGYRLSGCFFFLVEVSGGCVFP